MLIIKPAATLEWLTPDALKVIERAGRVCYKSEDKITGASAEKFVAGILARGHEAVIEHASASFRLITDRGLTHEIVRHRLASYCQESTRYCNYSADKFAAQIAVIEPPDLDAAQQAIWRDACAGAEKAYFALLAAGTAPQIARAVLPTCLKTELVMTANFREWRHFLKLRLADGAHPQIRELARQIAMILSAECPAVFGEF
ncbi:thymidylate synthase [Planctomycetales bacterium]|nr:thymidylate synthase [Planctomycetales bacterium]GHT02751.1 thymidylate synthase [Planctomycetales bacterium]GHV21536.1 thymidylate synthase [Planctomycetales bacterium]